MAIMIPSTPHDFTPESKEDVMFYALENGLTNDYYVFHSFKTVGFDENDALLECECDFMIYNQTKGILCLEAKAGKGVHYSDGEWYYGSGIMMSHGGPFRQAQNAMHKIQNAIGKTSARIILDNCKFLHGVWFPGVNQKDINTIAFPTDSDKSLVMPFEALADPLPYIEKLFERNTFFNKHTITETVISDGESKWLLHNVLCPSFDVFPTSSFEANMREAIFNRMLREQQNVLDFLEDQKVTVINGAAGTGKTMVAVEKARRNAAKGDKVLFLCYNRMLRDRLAEDYPYDNVEYRTLDSLACFLCNTSTADYEKLGRKLNAIDCKFPWKHVIVDEGQDFGRENMEESNILSALRDVVVINNEGTFFVFYDKLQLVQGVKIPNFIEEADCKLTLYKNCRNTKNIAVTSLRPIAEREPELRKGALPGVPARIFYCDDHKQEVAALDALLKQYAAEGYKDIAILTVKTAEQSILYDKHKNGLYKNKYVFTTYRKFKGLEADVVILVDVDASAFTEENKMNFYVASSRAKTRLDIISNLSEDECSGVLTENLGKTAKVRRPRLTLASTLNASPEIFEDSGLIAQQ